MSYYVYQSNNTIRSYAGTCVSPSVRPVGDYQNWYLVNGRWVGGSVGTTSQTTQTYYKCYDGDVPTSYSFDLNFVLLPSLLVVGFLFSVIHRWFYRRNYL